MARRDCGVVPIVESQDTRRVVGVLTDRDIILRVDRMTSAALVVMSVCVIASLAWHRVMGRNEPGAARFYALVSALMFAAVATLVSYDLAEVIAFWGLAGAVTYLMLAHRWTAVETSSSGRIALALPFTFDLSLLCGIAILYWIDFPDRHVKVLAMTRAD